MNGRCEDPGTAGRVQAPAGLEQSLCAGSGVTGSCEGRTEQLHAVIHHTQAGKDHVFGRRIIS